MRRTGLRSHREPARRSPHLVRGGPGNQPSDRPLSRELLTPRRNPARLTQDSLILNGIWGGFGRRQHQQLVGPGRSAAAFPAPGTQPRVKPWDCATTRLARDPPRPVFQDEDEETDAFVGTPDNDMQAWP